LLRRIKRDQAKVKKTSLKSRTSTLQVFILHIFAESFFIRLFISLSDFEMTQIKNARIRYEIQVMIGLGGFWIICYWDF
jgi:hypothetical protein